ncbi:DUF805 domain-containing protein [Providencia manganoxydans]|uniref:DUF805 domain-containing protein n=1 Tax=Providencia manganoxydans TaxID=2923283 RepID=UPI0034DD43B0
MISSIFNYLKKSLNVKLRATRRDYWSFQAINIPLILFCMYFFRYSYNFPHNYFFFYIFPHLLIVYILISSILSLTLTAKRLQDIGHSGWLTLAQFIPYFNIIIFLAMFFKGDVGDNKFGHDPRLKE